MVIAARLLNIQKPIGMTYYIDRIQEKNHMIIKCMQKKYLKKVNSCPWLKKNSSQTRKMWEFFQSDKCIYWI